MSSPFVFESITEHKHSMTVYFHDQHGIPGALTFGDQDSNEEYRIVGIGQGGRTYYGAEDPTIWFMLLKRGAQPETIFQHPDNPRGAMKVSHIVNVTAPRERASALFHACWLFMQGTKYALEHLYRVPKLRAITYEEDAFIISFDLYDTLKIGLTREHRRLLTRYDRNHFEKQPGFTPMRFWFKDEHGDELNQQFLVPSERIQEIAVELSVYVTAYQEQHHPKAEAAVIPYAYLQAA